MGGRSKGSFMDCFTNDKNLLVKTLYARFTMYHIDSMTVPGTGRLCIEVFSGLKKHSFVYLEDEDYIR